MNNCTRLQGNYTVTIMKRWLFVVVFYLADIDLCVLLARAHLAAGYRIYNLTLRSENLFSIEIHESDK